MGQKIIDKLKRLFFKGGQGGISAKGGNAEAGLASVRAATGEGAKYRCQICGRMIHEKHSLEHIKAEEYLIDLIRKDHSHWHDKHPTCEECVAYYRKLVDKTEI